MIRKKHSSAIENKNYIEMNNTVVYISIALLLIMTFVGGNFYGKIKSAGDNNPTAATPSQAPQVQAQQTAKTEVSLDTIKGLFAKNIIKFGKGDKKLLMVEVADPSCPFCQVAAGLNGEINTQMGQQFILKADGGSYIAPVAEMKKLVDSGKADFAWIYTNGHGNGELATKALYCAFDQNKFWQAHDLLMSAKGYDLLNNQIKADTTQTKLISDFLAKAVNANTLKSCLDSGKYDARLNDDSALARSLGVSGTPGFFLNTTNFSGAYSWTEMKSVADAAL